MRQFRLVLIGILLFSQSCRSPVIYKQGSSISNDGSNGMDTAIAEWLEPLSDSMNAEMNVVVGYTPLDFQPIRSKGRISETQQHSANLARLVSDYTLNWARKFAQNKSLPLPEMTVLNHNGLRNSIDSGYITLGQIYEVMPFDNELVLLVLSGTQMIELFDYLAQIGGSPLSGAEIYLGDTSFIKAIIQNNNFDSRRSYCIATVDFMQGGGDGFTMLKKPKRLIQTGVFLRDVIIEEMKLEMLHSNGAIQARTNPRIYHHHEP